MINHIWSVLCRESIIDIDSNTISLINVVEELIVDLKPDVKLPMGEKLNINVNYEVVSMWSRDSFDDRAIGLKIELINPDKNDRAPRYVYLGPKSYNAMGSFADFIEHKKKAAGAISSEAEPSQEEQGRFKYGWYWIKGHWYRPVFLPPSKFKPAYSSPYIRMMKTHIHNRLLSAQQIIIAGYSLPEADIEHLSAVFIPQIIDSTIKLKVVNPSNDDGAYRERIMKCFPENSDVDYSDCDFKEFCKKIGNR